MAASKTRAAAITALFPFLPRFAACLTFRFEDHAVMVVSIVFKCNCGKPIKMIRHRQPELRYPTLAADAGSVVLESG
jgi:hypothetical protein